MKSKITYELILFPDGESWGMTIGSKKGYKTLTNARKAAKKAINEYKNGGMSFVTIRKNEDWGSGSSNGIIETVNLYS